MIILKHVSVHARDINKSRPARIIAIWEDHLQVAVNNRTAGLIGSIVNHSSNLSGCCGASTCVPFRSAHASGMRYAPCPTYRTVHIAVPLLVRSTNRQTSGISEPQ